MSLSFFPSKSMVFKEKLFISGWLDRTHCVAVSSARSFICSTAAIPTPTKASAPTVAATAAPVSWPLDVLGNNREMELHKMAVPFFHGMRSMEFNNILDIKKMDGLLWFFIYGCILFGSNLGALDLVQLQKSVKEGKKSRINFQTYTGSHQLP